jgi:hypothetical protein
MAGIPIDTSSFGRVLLAEPDAAATTLRLTPITSTAIERASRLDPLDLRTLDAIHLDAALQLHSAGTTRPCPPTITA